MIYFIYSTISIINFIKLLHPSFLSSFFLFWHVFWPPTSQNCSLKCRSYLSLMSFMVMYLFTWPEVRLQYKVQVHVSDIFWLTHRVWKMNKCTYTILSTATRWLRCCPYQNSNEKSVYLSSVCIVIKRSTLCVLKTIK